MTVTYNSRTNPSGNYIVYKVNVHGDEFYVTVTSNDSAAEEWTNSMLAKNKKELESGILVSGFGLRGKPLAEADTINLCIGDRCLIFQISRAISVPSNLRNFLLDPRCSFVGFYNRLHNNRLSTCRHSLKMVNDPVDLTKWMDENLANSTVETIVQQKMKYHGVVPGDIDWNADPLGRNQVLHASTEVRCAFLMGCEFEMWKYRSES